MTRQSVPLCDIGCSNKTYVINSSEFESTHNYTLNKKPQLMKNNKQIIFLIFSVIAASSYAQSRVERIGLAFSGYYGSAVLLNIMAEGNCKKYLKINSAEYKPAILKMNINKTLAPILSKSDYSDLQQMYFSIDSEMKNMSVDLNRIPQHKCANTVDEYTRLYQAKKLAWDNSLR